MLSTYSSRNRDAKGRFAGRREGTRTVYLLTHTDVPSIIVSWTIILRMSTTGVVSELRSRITKSFPHWFCDRFATYSGSESTLPIDQHQLIALIAPRAVYVTSASDDLWADPHGEYLSLVEAAPVYKLLGRDAVETHEMATLSQPRIVGKTGYHIRIGEHGLNAYDWEKYLDFCDKQWASD